MDILYKKPNIKFIIEYPNRQIEKKIDIYYESQNDMLEIYQPSITIEEFDTVYIIFQHEDKTARLYLEGLELIPEKYVQLDENGDPFLLPGEQKCPLYIHDSEFYPIRVGKYRLKVRYSDKEYFGLIQVDPKHLSINEWEILKNDLESELRGLAQDLIRKNIGLGTYTPSAIPVEKLYKFLVINKYSDSIIGALIDLKERPNYKIVKSYKKEKLFKIKEIDYRTIKDYLIKGTEADKYLVARRIISFDLQENRWLKKIIKYYENELNAFQNLIFESKKMIREEIEELKRYQIYNNVKAQINVKESLIEQLLSYNMTVEKILRISNIIKTQSWYSEISALKDGTIPHVLIMDSRYSIMYRLYRELNNNEFKIEFNHEYSYAWKLTSKLYEIWCFVKICTMITTMPLNFEAQGWLFESKKDQLIIPMLKPGTCIMFKNNNCLLKLYFDTPIPKGSAQTDIDENPIYTNDTHTRPDARLDIYVDNIYIRSIIFEFKYRTINNFWYKTNNTTSYNQIISYRHHPISCYTRGLPELQAKEIKAISEVWVFYPTGENKKIIEKSDQGIKLIRLKPDEDNKEIVENLNELIKSIINEKR